MSFNHVFFVFAIILTVKHLLTLHTEQPWSDAWANANTPWLSAATPHSFSTRPYWLSVDDEITADK